MNKVSSLHVKGGRGTGRGPKLPPPVPPFFLATSLQPFSIAKYQALLSLSPSLFLLLLTLSELPPALSSLPPMPLPLPYFPKRPPLCPPLQT